MNHTAALADPGLLAPPLNHTTALPAARCYTDPAMAASDRCRPLITHVGQLRQAHHQAHVAG